MPPPFAAAVLAAGDHLQAAASCCLSPPVRLLQASAGFAKGLGESGARVPFAGLECKERASE
ncbi:MAG TPA: hypothetical protein DCP91_05995 [Eggerthellaceae bacterium]|nr:hypothetical protein [Eggerthellaceae bacterium]